MQEQDMSSSTPSALPERASLAKPVMQHLDALRDTIASLTLQNHDPALQPLIAEATAHCAAIALHFDWLNTAQFAPGDSVDAQVFERLMALAGPATTMELLDQLLIDLDAVRQALAAADTAKDWDILRNQCHVLIAIAGAIGAHGVQTGAENLHSAAVATDARMAHGIRQTLLAQLQSLLSFVRDERQARGRR
jgi:hypothetical protein